MLMIILLILATLNPENVVTVLEDTSVKLSTWFELNSMKANPEKYHLLLTQKTPTTAHIGHYEIASTKSEKLLGITIDSNLSFETHVNNICSKASHKLYALARISPYMNIVQRRKVMKAFISSQFGFCPLVWMLHSRRANNRINRIHERALRIVYNDTSSNFQDLLNRDNTVSIHHRNLRIFATELYKVKNGMSTTLMNELFQSKINSYNLRSRTNFYGPNPNTVHFGTMSLTYLAPKIWKLIPENVRNCETLMQFKNNIKKWFPYDCPCRLCKVYIHQVGFV